MDEDDDHEKHIADAMARMKKQTDEMMQSLTAGMMESMAPMLSGTQLLGDEAKAWDQYVGDFISAIRLSEGQALPENAVAFAVQHADALLTERKKRFNEETLKERMRGTSGRGLCNQVVLRIDGSDSGHRCARNEGHEGNLHY
jgi:hypothetical protein